MTKNKISKQTLVKKSKKAKSPKGDPRDELLASYTRYIGLLENSIEMMQVECAFDEFLETCPTIH
jgi:hypothetical protein